MIRRQTSGNQFFATVLKWAFLLLNKTKKRSSMISRLTGYYLMMFGNGLRIPSRSQYEQTFIITYSYIKTYRHHNAKTQYDTIEGSKLGPWYLDLLPGETVPFPYFLKCLPPITVSPRWKIYSFQQSTPGP